MRVEEVDVGWGHEVREAWTIRLEGISMRLQALFFPSGTMSLIRLW